MALRYYFLENRGQNFDKTELCDLVIGILNQMNLGDNTNLLYIIFLRKNKLNMCWVLDGQR